MRLPAIRGIIDRRILANYHVDADYMAKVLPPPFRPQLVNGYAIGGICLIRLKNIRPKILPLPWGIGSENAAHRIAVEWEADNGIQHGVYIPRRDTNSRLNSWAGGRIFPGLHHHAFFDVHESEQHLSVTMKSEDELANVHVSGRVVDRIPDSSVFDSLQSASQFFENGSLGYSDTKTSGRFDGLQLKCEGWQVRALDTDRIESSYFDDLSKFPAGTVAFDCSLVMHNIVHEWRGRPDLYCGTSGG